MESWFVLFRVTGDEMYRDWGWDFARALERYARVGTGGYTSLDNVMNVPEPGHGRDKMESFFLAVRPGFPSGPRSICDFVRDARAAPLVSDIAAAVMSA